MTITQNLNIYEEWKQFVEKGKIPHSVEKEVLDSWKRCKDLGVDAFSKKPNCILTSYDLEKRLKAHKKIILFSKYLYEEIIPITKGSGCILYITDANGNILHVDGDKDVIKELRDGINFYAGASWSEETVGTTAVSLALSTRKSIPFVSNIKYCSELKQKACCAVPILGKSSQVLAILGLVSNNPNPNILIYGLFLPMVKMVQKMLEKVQDDEVDYLEQCYYKAFHLSGDPIIVTNEQGIIVDMNKPAKILLEKDKELKTTNNLYAPYLLQNLPQLDEINRWSMLKKKFLISDDNKNVHYSIHFLKPSNKGVAEQTNYSFKDIIGNSQQILETIVKAKQVSNTNFSVLIQGESGTGKEIFAQSIHSAGTRSNGPFIAVNCASLPESLVESELFGYDEGAFTGAIKKGKKGKFEQANGGTIFLDEIGDMSLVAQSCLLRVLQEKEIVRVGSNKEIPIDFRVIAATNKDLYEEVQNGRFREDLYWRLNEILLQIPPLRDRDGDIKLLLDHFTLEYGETETLSIAEEVINILENYTWPGNIRELSNFVKKILLFKPSIVEIKDLPNYMIKNIKPCKFMDSEPLESYEKEIILKVLRKNNNNVSKTARELDISRGTIYNRLNS